MDDFGIIGYKLKQSDEIQSEFFRKESTTKVYNIFHNSALYKYLNKDEITDIDISNYLSDSQRGLDTLEKSRHIDLADPQYHKDIAIIEKLKAKDHEISLKLRNGTSLTKEETGSLLESLNDSLFLLRMTKEENIKEGLEKYINQLKNKLGPLD